MTRLTTVIFPSFLFSLLCGTVWNRDVNSALNIYGIFVYKSKHDNESPPPFKRPSED